MAGSVRITHGPSGTSIAEGPLGWGILPFGGSLYIARRYLMTDGFKANFVPGLCSYKFLYVWLDLHLPDGSRSRSLGWRYVLPNPLFFFLWWRVGLDRHHPELVIEQTGTTAG